MHLLLEGVVGSKAFGLDTPDSDTDWAGIFVEPTASFLGLNPPTRDQGTVKGRDTDDATYHEVAKAMRLALTCNPSAMELLWLSDYTVTSAFGEELIGLRTKFLSAQRVRDAYLGYAKSQYGRLVHRGVTGNSTDRRREKHARHIARLLDQGFALYALGELEVRVPDRQWVFNLGASVAQDPMAERLRDVIKNYEVIFDHTRTPLPNEPDTAPIEDLLHRIRHANLAPLNTKEMI